LGTGRAYRTAGALDKAKEALLESLALYQGLGNAIKQSESLGALASITMFQSHFAEAERFIQQGLVLTQETDQQARAYLLGFLGRVLFHSGEFAEAEEAATEAIRIYLDGGSNWMATLNMGRLTDALLHQGKYDQTLGQLEAIQTFLNTTRVDKVIHNVAAYVHPWKQASVALAQGRYAEAHTLLEDALATWILAAYSRYERSMLIGCLALALYGLGCHNEAWLQLEAGLHDALDNQSYLGLLLVLTVAALLEVDQGEAVRGVELYATVEAEPFVTHSIWYADIAGKEIAKAASQLNDEIVATARLHGKKADLWKTGQALVNSLTA
jgi:hypothetical protein